MQVRHLPFSEEVSWEPEIPEMLKTAVEESHRTPSLEERSALWQLAFGQLSWDECDQILHAQRPCRNEPK